MRSDARRQSDDQLAEQAGRRDEACERTLQRSLDMSRMQGGMAPDDGWNRRRLLKSLAFGAGAAAAVVGPGLVAPATALAVTNDVLLDRGGAVFNVMAYGADNTGASNTQRAIATAISAAQSAGGGIVYLPAGTYRIDSALTVTATGVTIQGAGIGATTIRAGASFTTGDMVYFNQVKYGRVTDLTIDSVNMRTSGAAINFFGITAGEWTITVAAGHIAHNVWCDRQHVGILLSGQQFLSYLDRIYITRLNRDGVGIDINCVGDRNRLGVSQFVSNVFVNGGVETAADQPLAAVRVRSSGDYTLKAFSCIFCRYGLLIDPDDGDGVIAGFHEGCLWDTSGEYNVFIRPHLGGRVQSLGFVNCWTSGARRYDGIYIAGNVRNVQFTAHRSYSNCSWGFACQGAQGSRSIFLDQFEALSNDVLGYGSGGILFDSVNNFAVRNSHIGQEYGGRDQDFGIQTLGNADDYVILNNIIRDSVVANISDGASGRNRIVANNLLA